MNIEELTIKQVREISALVGGNGSTRPDSGYITALVGKNVIIRTVTMIYTGKLIEVTPTDFVLVDCSWIPDTGRFMQFVADGSVNECEPYPEKLPVSINRGAYLDLCEMKNSLPRSQK